MLAGAAMALAAGVAGAALAMAASGHRLRARGPFRRGGFFARIIDLSLLGGGRFAPTWRHQPSAAG